MKVGSIRAAKQEQNEALQRDTLKEVECKKYFRDKITGSKFEQKGRGGDTVIAWKLDWHGEAADEALWQSYSMAQVKNFLSHRTCFFALELV